MEFLWKDEYVLAKCPHPYGKNRSRACKSQPGIEQTKYFQVKDVSLIVGLNDSIVCRRQRSHAITVFLSPPTFRAGFRSSPFVCMYVCILSSLRIYRSESVGHF